ncbi:thioredoxin-disulfide reductase [Candidatus Electronema sp. JM]|uniref:thioredoxin-disulfide reductase n=1 Tax=Candidatus Electronema sp. JM TaxID=3401571 RepID=UPI003AA91213
MNKPDYQLIIVGGGPAGLTAGLYAARGRIKTLLIEKGATGGQVLMTDWVDNYPAFADGVTGFELMDKMTAHAERFGLEKKFAAVESLDLRGDLKKIRLDSGEILTAQAVILCTGAKPRQIGVPGEAELQGKGVSYCATCDGPFYRNQEIAVVGGGNTAIQEAIHLTHFAKKVTVIHRRDSLRATAVLQEKALANEKINFIWNAQVSEILGADGVEAVRIKHNDDSASVLPVTGIFVLIGVKANNEALPLEQLQTDADGFLITDSEMACPGLPGVYAAGDIRSKKFRQIINAAGEGANAELSAEHYLGILPG